jgi:hypothetical protein
MPFPGHARERQPAWVELRAARRGGFSGRVARRKRERTPGGHVGAPARVSVTDAVTDATTPGPRADDACIREAASARAALPPRSPWTTSGSSDADGLRSSSRHQAMAPASALLAIWLPAPLGRTGSKSSLPWPDLTYVVAEEENDCAHRDGAFMETSRRNRWQSAANRPAAKRAKTSEIRCRGLPPVAVTPKMVRRGSTVRVRQRAFRFLLLRQCFRCRGRRRSATAASIGRPKVGRRRL